jgi:uncharacterized protein (DUF1697 family)
LTLIKSGKVVMKSKSLADIEKEIEEEAENKVRNVFGLL